MTSTQPDSAIVDGYETITDYSLLEQVRDAIEDLNIQHTTPTKTSANKPLSVQSIDISNHMFTQIIHKMKVKSQHTKERIKGVILEIQDHENHFKQKHKRKSKQLKIELPSINEIDSNEIDVITTKQQNTISYEELNNFFQKQMKTSLSIDSNTLKTKDVLSIECSNEQCEMEWLQNNMDSFMEYCPCVNRINTILNTYQKYKNNNCLWGKVSISSIFCCQHYGFQQLVDDFLHIRIIHLDKNESNTIEICQKFEADYNCDLRTCKVFSRHYRDRTDREKVRCLYYHNDIQTKYGQNKVNDIRNDKDIIFQQELDKIHSYFLHSTLKFGKGQYYDNPYFQQRKSEINDAAKGRSYSKQKNQMEQKQSDIPYIKPILATRNTMPHIYSNAKHKSFGSVELEKAVLHGRGYAHIEPYTKYSFNRHVKNTKSNDDLQKIDAIRPHNMEYAFTAQLPSKPLDVSTQSSSLSTMSPYMTSPLVISEDGAMDIGYTGFGHQESHEFEKEHSYVGIPEDKEWIQSIADIDSEEEIYNRLVQFCGIFRWQNAHGFRTRHFQGLQHIQAQFNNIKDEVLKNSYHEISTENWNQTLRKAKSFHNSWAAKKIRTPYDGQFLDQVTGSRFEWKKGEQIQLKEIVTLKLYTDFDRLQFELKKCFRWEYTQEVVESNKCDDEEEQEEIKRGDTDRENIDNEERDELEDRLQQFYHWRQSLVVVLNKYGRKLTQANHNYMLYHGVNAKLILNPAITPAFYGPLSTSSSFHVAKTFATDKGMVLTLSSQYPRLGICRAFDASLISDYPEEQEWLIGFIYSRIRKIHTKESFEWMQLPPASNLRFVFFALHLFRQQIFSMSEDLEEILIQIFLDRDSETNRALNKRLKKKIENISDPEERAMYRKAKILKILQKKYDEFREKPNSLQIVRVDDISPNLRQYFVDLNDETLNINAKTKGIDVPETNEYESNSFNDDDDDATHTDEDDDELAPHYDEYQVSFIKIKNIFKNVEEIHFYNYFRCDDAVLEKLNDFVQMKANQSLKQIKFLYYDYYGDICDNPYFCDPQKWNKMSVDNLEALGYKISSKLITNYGYKIRIYKVND